jgi:hypothetical protein
MSTSGLSTGKPFLSNCGEDLDRIMTDLEAVGYIYDFSIDTASVFSGLLN